MLEIVSSVVERRMFILGCTAAATFLLTAASFLIPNSYTASAVILPDVDVLSAAQKLGSLQDVASSVGLNLGVTSPSQLYPDILESETILRPVIGRAYELAPGSPPVTLMQYWGFDDRDTLRDEERCLRKAREKAVSVDVNKKTGIPTLSVETTDPRLSADVANEMVFQLDRYQREFRRSNASEQRKFLDQRLREVQGDLSRAEDGLRDFREKNRRVADSPQLLLEEDRRVRDVTLNTTLFIELKKQYELARLDEVKNTPVVQVLDSARPPREKSGPRRSFIAVVSFLLGLIGSSMYVAAARYIRQHPSSAAAGQWNAIARAFAGDAARLFRRPLNKEVV